MQSFLYIKGEVSPWLALRCSPPSLAGAQAPHPQRPGLPRPPALKTKRPLLWMQWFNGVSSELTE